MPSSEVPDIKPMYVELMPRLSRGEGSFAVRHADAHRFRRLQLRLGSASERRELRLRRGREGHGLGGLGHGQRIALLAVFAEFEMQVRPGGPAGGTHRADALALLDAR